MVPPLLAAGATRLVRRLVAIGSLDNAWVASRATSLSTFTRAAPEGTSLDFHLAGSQSMPAASLLVLSQLLSSFKAFIVVFIIICKCQVLSSVC